MFLLGTVDIVWEKLDIPFRVATNSPMRLRRRKVIMIYSNITSPRGQDLVRMLIRAGEDPVFFSREGGENLYKFIHRDAIISTVTANWRKGTPVIQE